MSEADELLAMVEAMGWTVHNEYQWDENGEGDEGLWWWLEDATGKRVPDQNAFDPVDHPGELVLEHAEYIRAAYAAFREE